MQSLPIPRGSHPIRFVTNGNIVVKHPYDWSLQQLVSSKDLACHWHEISDGCMHIYGKDYPGYLNEHCAVCRLSEPAEVLGCVTV